MKLTVIKRIHEEYTALLIKNNYKRADAKAGKLKTSASEARKAVFKHMQQGITETY